MKMILYSFAVLLLDSCSPKEVTESAKEKDTNLLPLGIDTNLVNDSNFQIEHSVSHLEIEQDGKAVCYQYSVNFQAALQP